MEICNCQAQICAGGIKKKEKKKQKKKFGRKHKTSRPMDGMLNYGEQGNQGDQSY